MIAEEGGWGGGEDHWVIEVVLVAEKENRRKRETRRGGMSDGGIGQLARAGRAVLEESSFELAVLA